MLKKTIAGIWLIIKGSISFLIFIFSSQFFTLLIPLPFSAKNRTSSTIYTRLLKAYAVFINKTHFNIKIHHQNFSKELFNSASLVVCNHQSILDVPISLAFSSKMCVINNNWHNNVWARFFVLKYIRLFPIDMGKDTLIEALRPSIIKGCPVLIFPEGVMHTNKKIGRFHKGGFYVASHLKLDIQPVVILYAGNTFYKRWFYLKNGYVIIKYLDRIKVGSEIYGNNYQELTKNTCAIMRKEYDALTEQYADML